MIELATWLAVIILGPGALAVFIWFLLDLRRIMMDRARDERESAPGP